jgi:hypothetical protein
LLVDRRRLDVELARFGDDLGQFLEGDGKHKVLLRKQVPSRYAGSTIASTPSTALMSINEQEATRVHRVDLINTDSGPRFKPRIVERSGCRQNQGVAGTGSADPSTDPLRRANLDHQKTGLDHQK